MYFLTRRLLDVREIKYWRNPPVSFQKRTDSLFILYRYISYRYSSYTSKSSITSRTITNYSLISIVIIHIRYHQNIASLTASEKSCNLLQWCCFVGSYCSVYPTPEYDKASFCTPVAKQSQSLKNCKMN